MGNKLVKDQLEGDPTLHLTVQDVNLMLEYFQEGNKAARPLSQKQFVNVISEISQHHPHPAFQPDIAEFAFDFFDANHDGKVDAVELVRGVSSFCHGTTEEKAKLAFRMYDLDKSGFITRKELRAKAESTLRLTVKIAKKATQQNSGSDNLPKGIKTFVASAPDTVVDEAFKADTDCDGKISMEEWVEAAKTNPVIQKFIDPFAVSTLFDVKSEVPRVSYEVPDLTPSPPVSTSTRALATSDKSSNINQQSEEALKGKMKKRKEVQSVASKGDWEQLAPFILDGNKVKSKTLLNDAFFGAAMGGHTDILTRLWVHKPALEHEVSMDVTAPPPMARPQSSADSSFDPMAKHVIDEATPLHAACYHRHKQAVLQLIDYGARVQSQSVGDTPLISACRAPDNAEIIEVLIGKGANVNMPGMWADALTTAIHYGHLANVKALLALGATVTHQSEAFYTPSLILAAQYRHEDIALLLLDYGVRVDCRSHQQATPLQMATALNLPRLAQALAEKSGA